MDILYNNNLINQIVDKLFKHRRCDYSEYNLQSIIYQSDIIQEIHRIPNQNYQKIYTSLFKKIPNPDICIIFLHGYGSNRLECSNILRSLNQNYAICSFDFSGSGKSEGDLITYGMKEKEDINSIIKYLRIAGFKKFILWGRSMGATSALLYCVKYNPKDIILQIIDSAFYSFEMIAFEIANKNVKAPQFVIRFALQMAKKNCGKFQYNPFEIELNNVGQCTVPALFVYSEQDNVINCQNTHMICSKYKGVFQKLVIEQNHNNLRCQDTIQKIYTFIDKYSKKQPLKSKVPFTINHHYFDAKSSRRYDITPSRKTHQRAQQSIDNSCQHNKSIKKGIERVNTDNYVSQIKKFDDYGTWISSKYKSELSKSIQTPQTPQNVHRRRQTGGQIKRCHLSLSHSFVTRSDKLPQFNCSPAMFKEDLNKELLDIQQFNAKTMTSQKCRTSKKINTVKSLGIGKYLSNSKYL